MLPNLLANDIFYEEPFYYEQHGPNQGDVVTLHHMSAESTKFIELVRRVVGVPGDTIALKAGRIWINGRQVERSKVDTAAVSGNDPADLIEYEETLPNGARYRILEKTDDGGQTNEFGPITLSENQYFVLGDNRDNSWDSRSHTFGLVYGLDIEGRPNLILMSRELEQIGRTVQP
jgi:signal peptidase I